MCSYLDVQDFFTAGLGCDIGGAYLLAKGLLLGAPDLTRLSGSFYDTNKYAAVSMARDKIDAMSGLAALGVGFLLQAIGYIDGLAGWGGTTTNSGEAAVGALFLVLAIAVVVGAGWVHRRARLKSSLIEMSHYILDGTRMAYPRSATSSHGGNVTSRDRFRMATRLAEKSGAPSSGSTSNESSNERV
jgi:hypothetical protein